MKACGICGLDVVYYFGGSPLETESGQGSLMLRHEFSGEIVELGSKAKNNASFVVGDSVMGNPVRECGTCKNCARA